jgi:hypothetical protein
MWNEVDVVIPENINSEEEARGLYPRPILVLMWVLKQPGKMR